ncbi:regucalcin-like [Chrysoperla carnea]|uniref:regucalcin-like n=1 Tax=Chrysoperla carnea TaxID=189513 RepID=UPI001D0945DC|nr:regucalcin-like [Chrysoperla carnea]XP_044738270.1 regucalcin-like [Chrysoperla carnea]
MAEPKIRIVAKKAIVGEGPHWDAKQQALYYVDIPGHCFHKYTPSNEKVTTCNFPDGAVSLVVPLKDTEDKFVVSHNRKIVIVTWDGVSDQPTNIEEICEVDTADGITTNRLNDGKCDPFGRLYAGTMGYESKPGHVELGMGSLYSFDLKNRKAKKLVGDISIANGLTWNLSLNKMYYIDTLTHKVEQFDYDAQTGNISNRETVFDFNKHKIPGNLPDGMTIDTEGCLWVCCFNGGRVLRIDPKTGELLRTITFDALQTTSATFGGPHLDILYVTSAAVADEKTNPKAGCLFEVTGLGVTGLPGDNAVL